MQKKIAYAMILCSLILIIVAVLLIRSVCVGHSYRMCNHCFLIRSDESVSLEWPPITLQHKVKYMPTAFSQFLNVQCTHSPASWGYVHGSTRRFLGKPSQSISGIAGCPLPEGTGPGSAVEFLEAEEKEDPELRTKILYFANNCADPECRQWAKELRTKYEEYQKSNRH